MYTSITYHGRPFVCYGNNVALGCSNLIATELVDVIAVFVRNNIIATALFIWRMPYPHDQHGMEDNEHLKIQHSIVKGKYGEYSILHFNCRRVWYALFYSGYNIGP